MSRLRVVRKGDDGAPVEGGFADAVRAMAEEAIADGAVAVLVVWEAPDGTAWRAAPQSVALARGLVLEMGERLAPDPPEEA